MSNIKKKSVKIILGSLIIILLWVFFSYKLLEVPPGITSDESAFGYNGALLAKTMRDENHRFMPFFVLSLGGADWRQPVTQYSTAIAFKLFGSSYYVLRSVSVFYMVLSTALLFYLLYTMGGKVFAIFGTLFFILTPIMMIQSHMGLDNIAPVPFSIAWILGLYLYKRDVKLKYLIISAIALGINFYTYKAMRIIVPTWAFITVVYLMGDQLKSYFNSGVDSFRFKNFYPTFVFIFFILPFFLIIPLLESKYPGAVFDKQAPQIYSYQQIFKGYLANLDPSFLYIDGDSTPYHSTGIHGALLLASLPFFLIGAYQSIRRRGFLLLILVVFLSSPIFFGLANSIHRASRLLAPIPFYSIICGYGLFYIWSLKDKSNGFLLWLWKGVIVISFSLILLNYFDFINYYLFTYPTSSTSSTAFPARWHQSYVKLAEESKRLNLPAAVESEVYYGDGVAAAFFEQSYFSKPLIQWDNQTGLPSGVMLLTLSEHLDGYQELKLSLPKYHILVPVK